MSENSDLKIIDMYQQMGPMLGLYENADGSLENVSGKVITVSNLNVRYPHKENLRTSKMKEENYCVYHPANENILMRHSLMVKMLRNNVNKYYNELFNQLVLNYMELLSNKEAQDKLSTSEATRLEGYPVITAADKRRIITLLKQSSTPKVINICMQDDFKKKGDVRSYKRATTVSFPLYRAVLVASIADKPKIGKTPTTVKFAKTLKIMFEKLIPYIIDPTEVAGYGSSSGAPSIRAMVECITLVAGSYNEHCELVGSPLIPISINEDEEYSKLKKFLTHAQAIPMQSWNEGTTVKGAPPAVEVPEVEATEIVVSTSPPWDTSAATTPVAGQIARATAAAPQVPDTVVAVEISTVEKQREIARLETIAEQARAAVEKAKIPPTPPTQPQYTTSPAHPLRAGVAPPAQPIAQPVPAPVQAPPVPQPISQNRQVAPAINAWGQPIVQPQPAHMGLGQTASTAKSGAGGATGTLSANTLAFLGGGAPPQQPQMAPQPPVYNPALPPEMAQQVAPQPGPIPQNRLVGRPAPQMLPHNALAGIGGQPSPAQQMYPAPVQPTEYAQPYYHPHPNR